MDNNETVADILAEMNWRVQGLYDNASVFTPSEVYELTNRIMRAHKREIDKIIAEKKDRKE